MFGTYFLSINNYNIIESNKFPIMVQNQKNFRTLERFTLIYLFVTHSRKNENLLRVESSNMAMMLSFTDNVQ